MFKIEEKNFIKKVYAKKNYFLVGDIGGTKSRFAIATIEKKIPKLITSFVVDSCSIKSFEKIINHILVHVKDKYKINITKACFAAAGKVSSNRKFIEITNLKPNLDADITLKKTSLKSVVLLNDFEAAAYGLDILQKKDFLCLNCNIAKSAKKGTKIILGAGTGLGQSFLMWEEHEKRYIPHPSEGGHADFAAQNKEELDLINFLRKDILKKRINIEWEDLVSGNGISNIYKYLEKNQKYQKTKESLQIKKTKYSPISISKYKSKDEIAKKTFEIFAKFYARYAKSFALQALATGGIYFVGSIAVENMEMFKQKNFLNEFINSYKMSSLLKKVPIFIVKDSDVGLYGAAIFGSLKSKNLFVN